MHGTRTDAGRVRWAAAADTAAPHVAVVPPGTTTVHVGGQNGVDATGAVVSAEVAVQSIRAVENASVALEAAGASLADVVPWTVLIATEADLGAAYAAIAPRLATGERPRSSRPPASRASACPARSSR